jgi:hypothetical protein
MFGNVLASHGKEQIKDMPFKKSSVTFMFFGKVYFNVLCFMAIVTINSWNFEDDGGCFPSKGQGSEASFLGSFLPNVCGVAVGTDKFVLGDGDEKLDAARNDFLSKEGIASNPVHVIQ